MNVATFFLIISLCFLAFTNPVLAKPIATLVWQDQNLKECVLRQAEKNAWQDVEQVTSVKCHGKDITSAQELVQFTNLTKLSLYNNKIKQLDLTLLKSLKELNLAKNRLTEVRITNLTELETLYLFRNKLTFLDVSGLAKVEKFRITQNQLSKIDIRPMKGLKQGYLFDNKLEDLAIDGLMALEFLDVRQNPMPDELYDHYDSLTGVVISHDGNADDWK